MYVVIITNITAGKIPRLNNENISVNSMPQSNWFSKRIPRDFRYLVISFFFKFEFISCYKYISQQSFKKLVIFHESYSDVSLLALKYQPCVTHKKCFIFKHLKCVMLINLMLIKMSDTVIYKLFWMFLQTFEYNRKFINTGRKILHLNPKVIGLTKNNFE